MGAVAQDLLRPEDGIQDYQKERSRVTRIVDVSSGFLVVVMVMLMAMRQGVGPETHQCSACPAALPARRVPLGTSLPIEEGASVCRSSLRERRGLSLCNLHKDFLCACRSPEQEQHQDLIQPYLLTQVSDFATTYSDYNSCPYDPDYCDDYYQLEGGEGTNGIWRSLRACCVPGNHIQCRPYVTI